MNCIGVNLFCQKRRVFYNYVLLDGSGEFVFIFNVNLVFYFLFIYVVKIVSDLKKP